METVQRHFVPRSAVYVLVEALKSTEIAKPLTSTEITAPRATSKIAVVYSFPLKEAPYSRDLLYNRVGFQNPDMRERRAGSAWPVVSLTKETRNTGRRIWHVELEDKSRRTSKEAFCL